MRSKEVENAIVKLDIEKDVLRNSINRANYDEEYREEIDLEDFKETKQAIDTALDYISELEKENKTLKYRQGVGKFTELTGDNLDKVLSKWYINKQVIRDKIKLYELEIETLKTLYPKSYMRDDDYTLYLIKIKALEELLEGE